MKLVIVGKSRVPKKKELSGYKEVWTVGTSKVVSKAHKVFELHGLNTEEVDWIRYEHIVDLYKKYDGFPLTNSICVMIAYALAYTDYEHIHLMACPMLFSAEREEERPAVAFWIGYAKVFGVNITWEGGIDMNKKYGYKGDE